jgi:hypothetical protein
MKQWLIFSLLFVTILSPVIACEATGPGTCFYVSNSGSDSNPGTLAQPFKTIMKADQSITARGANGPGSVIYVMPGVYNQTFRATASVFSIHLRAVGTADYPITLKSYDINNPAILWGELDMINRSGGHPAIYLQGGFYVIRDLVFENATHGVYGQYYNSTIESNVIRNIYGDHGSNPSGVGNPQGDVHRNNIIRNNRIYNVVQNSSRTDLFSENIMCIVFFRGNNNTANNNWVSNCGAGIRYKHHQYWNNASVLAPGETYTAAFYRNIVEDINDRGINLGGSNISVFENVIMNGSGIVLGGGDAGPFLDNFVYHNSLYNAYGGIYYVQAYEYDANPHNTTLRDNVIHARVAQTVAYDTWDAIKYSDYNCYNESDFRRCESDSSSCQIPFVNFTNRGFDLNSIFTTNMYANPSVDLRLSATSACRNAASDGLHMGAWTTDNPDYDIGPTNNTLIDQGDFTPPVISLGSASVISPDVRLYVFTNEKAACRYSNVSGINFNSMTFFGPEDTQNHETLLLNRQDGQNHTYYIKCQDFNGNYNQVNYNITFTTENRIYVTGDANKDGSVNLLDVIFVGQYLDRSTFAADADLNGDGTINIFDLVRVSANWGK